MSDISMGAVLDAITRTLREAYPKSHIYAEEVTQGLKDCDFIVVLVTSAQKQITGERYARTPVFDVIYFPRKGKTECYDVGGELWQILETIKLASGDLIRGTDMSFEVIDGVLHFRVKYMHVVRYIGEETKMEALEIE